MKIDTPSFERGKIVCGVYKIVFDDNWFYIGSTTNLRKRFGRWRTVFSNIKYLRNRNILNILPNITSVKFLIIKSDISANEARELEEELLSKYWESLLLLNRCPHTSLRSGTKGLRPYNGYIKPIKKKKVSLIPSTPPQKVARFDKDWNLIEVHPSKGHVERVVKNCSINKINKCLKGLIGQVCNFKFKLVLEDGSFLEPPKFIPKNRIGMNTVPKFYLLDLNNKILKDFYNIRVAADYIGTGHSHVSDVLRKYRYDKTVKGFKLEYAEAYHKKYG